MNQTQQPSSPAPLRLLILGGTGEAFEIAERLADYHDFIVISSLAGRIDQPRLPEGCARVGGFGGVAGLIAYLQIEQISIVIDATHPFAARISVHAAAACTHVGVPLIAFLRPPWVAVEGDQWHRVRDMASAAAFIAEKAGRVFLAIGRQQLDAFTSCRNAWLLIRAIDPPDHALPPNTQLVLDRGPFHLQQELQLLEDHAIDYIVSKNSGGPATYAKIEAARLLGIPVVMIDRPGRLRTHAASTVDTIDGVFAELRRWQLRRCGSEETCTL